LLRRNLEVNPAKHNSIWTERGAGYVRSAQVDIIY
jgi:hypothetical protein